VSPDKETVQHLRIGISAGEPIEEHGYLFGAFVSGCYLGLRLTLLKEAKKAFRDIGNTQRFAAMISVTALDRLENGDIDGTKRLLATNVSGYYRSSIKDDPFAIEPKLRETIEKTSEHSPVLKQMLATPSR
jgi:hypothetical protein